MAEAPAKKLNLPLYLNPVVSPPDQVAMNALEQWYKTTSKSCGGPGPELDSLIREFHHDLYLAGLHLYLINPRLCRHVADALQENPTAEALDAELKACGLWPESQSAAAANDDHAFSSTQLEQLQSLLNGVGSSAQSDQGSAELLQQMAAMESELKQLRTLVEEQSQQLRRLKTAPVEPVRQIKQKDEGAEEMDVSGMAAQVEKIQEIRKKGVF